MDDIDGLLKPHKFIAEAWKVAVERKEVEKGWWTLFLGVVEVAGWDARRGVHILGAEPAFDSFGTYRMVGTRQGPWHGVGIRSYYYGM